MLHTTYSIVIYSIQFISQLGAEQTTYTGKREEVCGSYLTQKPAPLPRSELKLCWVIENTSTEKHSIHSATS